jgi:hypothetical protein
MTERIQARIKEILASSSPADEELRIAVATHRALPLALDGGGGYAIRPDGEIVVFLWDDKSHCEVEKVLRIRNMALFQGSRKYPELSELVPLRSPDDIDCPNCGGTGIEPISVKLGVDNIVCYCGGLGWIPKEESEW